MNEKIQGLLGPMRIPFLVLTPACVLLGLGTSIWSTRQVDWFYFILALSGALSAHISVNAWNEYFDFKSGLDFKTLKTPFSGGSGTLPKNPGLSGQALAAAIGSFLITALIGLYFLFVRGLLLFPLGLFGLLVIVSYTPWITRHPFLCLIAPGLGFGPLMVMGTHFVLTGEYSWTAFVASLIPFFLVSDLLLLNQFPDVEPDRSVGRRHFPLMKGRKESSLIYGLFLLLAFLSIAAGVFAGLLPTGSLLGLAGILLAIPAFLGSYRHAEDIPKLMPSLGLNVIINIATPVLAAVGLFMG